MKGKIKIQILVIFLFVAANIFADDTKLKKTDVLDDIYLVNRSWQANHSPQKRAFWDNAVYHTGNMEAYFLTEEKDFLRYSETWAEYNQWKGAKSDEKSGWKYHYGESDEFVLFGDYQVCFQTYADLYTISPDSKKIARAQEVLEYQMHTDSVDYWWWADGLYMVMPVMTKMYKITQNPLYLEKMHEYFTYTNSVMYDREEKLYYRDGKYIYPQHKTENGKKDFWARGVGWAFAAMAKILSDLPQNDFYRPEYEQQFKDMAVSIVACQQPEGYWTRSLLDSTCAPGRETSGTALFAYGLFWGINHGYLEAETYLEPAMRAWNYLSEIALQPDGKLGYVQPIGERAIPGQVVNVNSTSNFGVGAFLLAACEVYRYMDAHTPQENTNKHWKLVWSDEFNKRGNLNNKIWNYEIGFKRNHEDQWYQPENAYCKSGKLVITAQKEEKLKNPNYKMDSRDWRKNREYIQYTSSSVTTAGKKEFLYGRFEVCARIPIGQGAWPAIWLLGNSMPWPSCGEIDMMEYYRIGGEPYILANAAWGKNQHRGAAWDSAKIPFLHFTEKDAKWADKFHVWRMDWDEETIKLYLDDELLNEIPLMNTYNGKAGNYRNPFRQPQYILLNLAIGGDNGGTPDPDIFPLKYEIDYVRVYQLVENEIK